MNQRVAELAERYWDELMRAVPLSATLIGDHRFNHLIGDASPEELDRVLGILTDVAEQAEAIDPEGLDKQDRITRAMLISEARSTAVKGDPINAEIGIDPLTGVISALISGAAQTTVDTAEHADALFDRYSQTGRYLAEHLDWHRRGLEKGRVAPAANIDRVLQQIDAYLASPIEADPFVNISVPAEGAEAWRTRMAGIVQEHVRPAIATYRRGLADEIAPRGRPDDKPGLMWINGGAEWYEQLIEAYTTLHETADAIHQIGLDAMVTLDEEYRQYGLAALGTDDLAEMFDKLRTDPEFKFTDSAELLSFNEAVIERAEAAIADWFGRLPAAKCRMAEIPAALAPNMPPAYYFPPPADGSRPGTYFLNTHDAPAMQTFDMESVAFHEAVPGHHLQCAINAEAGELPMFRRYSLITSYAEGWGLYAERLADEMGLYSSDVDRIGMVSADAWRAGRLVVDTGIHAKGWTRGQAVEYLTTHTPIKEVTVRQEVDRYIGYPGQALAYKMGQREIFRLRSEAQERLGDRFDVKAFHDTVLTSGAMPLPMLDELVTEWIEAVLAD